MCLICAYLSSFEEAIGFNSCLYSLWIAQELWLEKLCFEVVSWYLFAKAERHKYNKICIRYNLTRNVISIEVTSFEFLIWNYHELTKPHCHFKHQVKSSVWDFSQQPGEKLCFKFRLTNMVIFVISYHTYIKHNIVVYSCSFHTAIDGTL